MRTERRDRRRGLVLMALLLMLVLVGVSALVVSEVAATTRAREQEAEMLWIGEQYRLAVERFWKASPGRRVLPVSLEQLLHDDRFPNPVHHLRQAYKDPFDPTQDLELIKWNNGVVGVHSTVQRAAIKRANFPPRYQWFSSVEDSSDWRFVFVPPAANAQPLGTRNTLPGGTPAPGIALPAPAPGGGVPLNLLPSRR